MEANLLVAIAEQYGCPTYVYDGNKIESQFDRLENAFKGVIVMTKTNIKLLYYN